MSTIKASSDHLVLSSDGSTKEVQFQIDGVEKASISSAGAFTSTTIDATALTGALPAISGASLTSLPATTSITTTNSSDTVFDHALKVNNSGGLNDSFVSLGFHNRADVNTTGIKGALVFDGNGQSDGIGDFVFCNSTAADIATAVTPSDETFRIKSDGRGLSQFTAKAWINFNGQSTVAIRDSHNVSSITDNGTGSYNVTMSNAMGSVNYSVTATSGRGAGEDMHALIPETAYNQTTTQFRILTLQSWDTAHDASYVSAHVFGD